MKAWGAGTSGAVGWYSAGAGAAERGCTKQQGGQQGDTRWVGGGPGVQACAGSAHAHAATASWLAVTAALLLLPLLLLATLALAEMKPIILLRALQGRVRAGGRVQGACDQQGTGGERGQAGGREAGHAPPEPPGQP